MLGRVIEWDLYSVADRIKEIDAAYFVFFNYAAKRFEVHSKRQRGNTLALVLPYDRLDKRSVDYVLRTRVERIAEVIKETERENARTEKERIDGIIKKSLENCEI
jgi:hypothetical protein